MNRTVLSEFQFAEVLDFDAIFCFQSKKYNCIFQHFWGLCVRSQENVLQTESSGQRSSLAEKEVLWNIHLPVVENSVLTVDP